MNRGRRANPTRRLGSNLDGLSNGCQSFGRRTVRNHGVAVLAENFSVGTH
jgi:hypothetical protein